MPNLYHDTAEPAAALPLLEGDRRTDVVIVGGGLTGLSTSLALAERGADVVVLEAHEPGWGASGRNGGQVNPGLKVDPDARPSCSISSDAMAFAAMPVETAPCAPPCGIQAVRNPGRRESRVGGIWAEAAG